MIAIKRILDWLIFVVHSRTCFHKDIVVFIISTIKYSIMKKNTIGIIRRSACVFVCVFECLCMWVVSVCMRVNEDVGVCVRESVRSQMSYLKKHLF